MKNHFTLFLFFAVVIIFIAGMSYAQVQNSELAGKVCDIRRLFCGGGGFAVISFAIGVIGLLAFTGRLHWSLALVAAAGIIIFIGADQFVSDLTNGESEIDDNCECI